MFPFEPFQCDVTWPRLAPVQTDNIISLRVLRPDDTLHFSFCKQPLSPGKKNTGGQRLRQKTEERERRRERDGVERVCEYENTEGYDGRVKGGSN